MTDLSFEGRTVLITGSGRGLGRSHAMEMARRGASVVVNDILGDLAEATAADINAAGGRAVAAPVTIATDEGARRTVDIAMDAFGTIDVLVNNAGVIRTGYFTELSEEDVDIVLDVHLRAAFRITRLVWPVMVEKKYGRIVNTCSASGMWSHQGLASYAAGKAGLWGLTKALAYEGADHGIKVNALLPAAATQMAQNSNIPDMLEEQAKFTRKEIMLPEWRWQPESVTPMVTYLCSSACDYSGEAFSAVNGRYARVYVGVADGWITPDEATMTPENIAAHIGQIRDISHYSVPMWLFEEMRDAAERIDAGEF